MVLGSDRSTGHSESGRVAGDGEREFTLADILLALVRNTRLIVGTTALFFALGVVATLSSPPRYTATAAVIPESEGGQGGSISALRSVGASLGAAVPMPSASGGLIPEVYPDILRSREVRLAVVRDTFFIESMGGRATLAEYLDQPGPWSERFLQGIRRYTLGLPGLIASELGGGDPRGVQPSREGASTAAPQEEEAAAEVEELVSTSVDLTTGLMRVSVTTPDPGLSAAVARSFVEQFTGRVREIRTEKTRRNLAFFEERVREAAADLEAAENRLSGFLNRNRSMSSPVLLTEQERLQRMIAFKAELYGQLQAQATEAEIELQRSDPVVTLLEEPVPPRMPSGPSGALTVALFVIVGGLIGVGFAFVRTVVHVQSRTEGERQKWRELRRALFPFGRRTATGKVARPPSAGGAGGAP